MDLAYKAMANRAFRRAHALFLQVAELTGEPMAYQRAGDALHRLGRVAHGMRLYGEAALRFEALGMSSQARAIRLVMEQLERRGARA